MQVGEEHLTVPQLLAFGGCISFTLTSNSAVAKTSSAVSTGSARLRSHRLVGNTRADSGGFLDDHLVAAVDQFADTGGDESDAVFVNLGFFGDTDAHLYPLGGLLTRPIQDTQRGGAQQQWGGRAVSKPNPSQKKIPGRASVLRLPGPGGSPG